MYLGYILLTALVTSAVASVMIETSNGSFVPLVMRAPALTFAIRVTNYNDISYLATVLIGTPPQRVQMSPSLSQNDILVASPPPGVIDATYYNPNISSSYMPASKNITVQTMSNRNITGRFLGEVCSVISPTLVYTYNAAVIVTDPSVTDDLYPVGARGILGYGVTGPADIPSGASLFSSTLPPNFTKAVCGIEMNHIDDPVPDGLFTLGDVDASAFTGDFTTMTVPQGSQISWSIPFDGLTYLANGQNRTIAGSLVSIDMHYSSIRISTDMARQLYSDIPGSQSISDTSWSLPCTSKFPITLTFGGRPFTINERDTIIKLSNGTCLGVVTGGALGIAQVGAPFLRNVYTQFGVQMASDRSYFFFVGFATKKLRQGSSTKSTSTATSIFAQNVLALTHSVVSVVFHLLFYGL